MLSKQDEQRAMVLGQVSAGVLGIVEAAGLIGVSERQTRRLVAAYQRAGPRGIVHGNRGRPPSHATSPELRAQVIALARSLPVYRGELDDTVRVDDHYSCALIASTPPTRHFSSHPPWLT